VGTFSAALPRSGAWLDRLKQGMGLVVLGFAVWNVRYIVPEWANLGMWSAVALVGAAILGAFRPAEGLPSSFAKGAGLLALALGALLGIRSLEAGLKLRLLPFAGGGAEAPRTSTWMEQDLEGALARARAEGKVVVVDIYAEWCAQCHELDEKTWPDPQVQAWLREHAIAIRIDTDKVRTDLAGKLQIRSYPTVLVLDGDGKELRRLLGFEKPPKMLAFLKG
jgi:thiol:disulfide interchange protein DsbD